MEDGDSGSDQPDMGAPVQPDPPFVDVTAAAGLEFDPGELMAGPFCVLDHIHNPEPGHYCLPERYLGAVAVGDYDRDGWPDVFMTSLHGPNRLMRNRGDGTFEDRAAEAGLHQASVTSGAAWLDIEGDGDLDLMLTGFGSYRNFLYVNDGTGHFSERAVERGAAVQTDIVHVGTGIGVGDYDRDGYLDVFVADWHSGIALGGREDHNRLLHNRGADAPGYFEDVTVAMGIDMVEVSEEAGALPGAYGFAPGFVDLDGDDWPELTVVADYACSRLFWNDGGQLVDVTVGSGVGTDKNGMGSAFGDYDGDGDLDWFVTSIWLTESPAAEGNRFYRNDGGLQFTDVTDVLGVREGGWGWGTSMFDADHDGDLDLTMTAGWPSVSFDSDPVRLWMNDGGGPWPDEAIERGVEYANGRGLVTFDYDRDGDLDLLVHSNTDPPALFRNETEGGWLQVQAVGEGGNRFGIGTVVRVQAEPNGPWQVRHIGVGSHLFGQEEAIAHFGLGDGEQPLHRVEITWPRTGQTVMLGDVARDQRLLVYE